MEKLQFGKGTKALYIQIKDIYRHKIINGELKYEDKIESEMEIQNIFGVSRITARQAILDLEKEGMVKRGRGKGTFVIWKPGIEEELTHISSFTQEMEAAGRKPGTSYYSITKEKMDDKTKKEFGVDLDDVMYCVRRVRTADDVKVVYMVSYYPLSTNLPMNSDSIKKIRAELPDEETIKALNIAKGQPILYRSRISYDEDNNIFELSKCYFRGDLYSYTISSTESWKRL